MPYFLPGGALHIELHKELFPSESQAYGKLNDYFKDVFQRKIREEIHGVGIILCAIPIIFCI